jgi:hypothetical protein
MTATVGPIGRAAQPVMKTNMPKVATRLASFSFTLPSPFLLVILLKVSVR